MPDYPLPEDIVIGHEKGLGGYVNYSVASQLRQRIVWKLNVLKTREITRPDVLVNAPVHEEYLIVHDLCPCAVCNHRTMDQCQKAECECCSHQCT